jgi:hypothetical protein
MTHVAQAKDFAGCTFFSSDSSSFKLLGKYGTTV